MDMNLKIMLIQFHKSNMNMNKKININRKKAIYIESQDMFQKN